MFSWIVPDTTPEVTVLFGIWCYVAAVSNAVQLLIQPPLVIMGHTVLSVLPIGLFAARIFSVLQLSLSPATSTPILNDRHPSILVHIELLSQYELAPLLCYPGSTPYSLTCLILSWSMLPWILLFQRGSFLLVEYPGYGRQPLLQLV